MNNEIYTIISAQKSKKLWKFHQLSEGFVYYKNYRINLVSGNKEDYPILDFIHQLDELILSQSFARPRVIHIFYEFSHVIFNENTLDGDLILAIDLKYQKRSPYVCPMGGRKFKIKGIKSIDYKTYKKKFLMARKDLLKGNAYQLNLTFPYEFSIKGDFSWEELLGKLWSNKGERGAYAHASFLPTLNKIFISNSPECLFQIKKNGKSLLLWSMPIKGSQKIYGEKNFNKTWSLLKNCKKNQSELFMIADLIRNDLCKIEKPIAKIISRKKPLQVTKILHQYSLISVHLPLATSLFSILKNLFPGGSITGAPKKKAVEILHTLEDGRPREFYCGTTIVLHKSLIAGSINIRSATANTLDRRFIYGAGGGITLDSRSELEFAERYLKFKSFILNLVK